MLGSLVHLNEICRRFSEIKAISFYSQWWDATVEYHAFRSLLFERNETKISETFLTEVNLHGLHIRLTQSMSSVKEQKHARFTQLFELLSGVGLDMSPETVVISLATSLHLYSNSRALFGQNKQFQKNPTIYVQRDQPLIEVRDRPSEWGTFNDTFLACHHHGWTYSCTRRESQWTPSAYSTSDAKQYDSWCQFENGKLRDEHEKNVSIIRFPVIWMLTTKSV